MIKSTGTRLLAILTLLIMLLVSSNKAAVEAQHGAVRSYEEKMIYARALDLSQVRLTGGPLKNAQDLTAKYLLELEPDRMLAYYRIRAGLQKKAEPYGGWDGSGRNLTGHIAGHYLSAVSLMYAATGNPKFKERADYIVKELKEIQDKNGDGYLGALEGGREAFEALARGDIRTAAFDLNGLWAPWYVFHKLFAGLRDAYRFAQNRLALELEIKFAAWAEKILSKLNEEQVQLMLNTEFGGMNEVLVDLYADTGDRRWLDLSYKFEHKNFIFPLQHFQDNLARKHGNTQIPKLIGSADRYAYTGNAADLIAAMFFFNRVARHHSFATGGHGQDEYFGEADKLSEKIDDRTAETCNVYNMIKLGRRLFEFFPDPALADFQERALFNHILASIDPADGRTCYMVPVGRGVQHEYQDMLRSFTCCVGSGMESHALHGHGIYYESGSKLWVNLYVPSFVNWSTAGVRFRIDTDFPEGESATIKIEVPASKKFILALRRPWWAEAGFVVTVNNEPIPLKPPAAQSSQAKLPAIVHLYLKDIDPSISSYVEIERVWKNGDVVTVTMPKKLRLEPTPDNNRRAAILWGPLVLAGDIGPAVPRREKTFQQPQTLAGPNVPVFISAGLPLEDWVKPVPAEQNNFKTAGVGRPADVNLFPFYRLHRRTYAIYWDLYTEEEWKTKEAEDKAEEDRLRQLEARTISYFQPGDPAVDKNYNFQGENATSVIIAGRSGRTGSNWFSFDMPVEAETATALIVTYHNRERRREVWFKIFVEGKQLAEEKIKPASPSRFFNVEYPLPQELTRGKTKITVRFETIEGFDIGPVFGLRVVRAAAAK